MRTMDLPKVTIPSDYEDALGRYRTRLNSRLRVPNVLSQSLLAYMAWPDDEDFRNSWMRSIIAQRLGHGGKLSISHPISNFGGLEAVAGEALDAACDRLATEM